MNEEERRAIVESGPVYLADGLRARLEGFKIEDHCSVFSARPGFWRCSWETAAEVVARPDRRFLPTDALWLSSHAWLGYQPGPEEYQTEADYHRAQAKETKS